MVLITSPSNPRISKLQTLQTARGRKKSGFFLMEGPHLLEGLLDAHLMPHEVYYQPELLQRTASGRALLERLLHTASLDAQQCVEVSERVIEAISDTQSSQGVVSVLPLDAFTPDRIRARRVVGKRPALLILDDVADPGNMGTILRTALAADVEMVLLTPNCVDWFSPKVVRAAAGAHLALPVESDVSWESIGQRVAQHAPERVFLAEADDGRAGASPAPYYKEDLRRPFVLIIGNEAHGPSTAARELATKAISIPLYNGVESLNAAMAAGIILYEAVRQRDEV